MSPTWMGLAVGGLAPAVGYALFAIATKFAVQAGISAGTNLVLVGLATAATGVVFRIVLPAQPLAAKAAFWSLGAGILWAAGTGLVSLAMERYGVPVSKLNPIYNTNTLLAVLLGLVLFSEWRQVEVPKLLLGALLILAGSLLVARA
jgi:uncharacterized membrane protein